MKKINLPFIAIVIALILGLTTYAVATLFIEESNEDFFDNYVDEYLDSDEYWRDINTVSAHNERDTIVGNFTGQGIDTLYVVSERDEDEYMCTAFYMVSTNEQIPRIKLHGFPKASPKLVLEHDLDGNGTDEVGYLHTWINSRWRYYRIFTLEDYEWRYLIEGEYLSTSDWFRSSGVEVAEPGPEKGTVMVHYYYEDYNDTTDEKHLEMRDTIVLPSFTKIEDAE